MEPGGYGARPSWRDQIVRTVKRSFDFSGRSARTELIYYYLLLMFGSFVLNLIFPVTISDDGSFSQSPLLSLFHWPMLVPYPALLVRRMHDQEKSGWWSLLFLIPNILGAAFGDNVRGFELPFLIIMPMILLVLILLFLSFRPGTDGENTFGSDPRTESVE